MTSIFKDVENWEVSYIAGENVHWCRYYGKEVWQLFKKLNMELPYGLTVTFLGIYPKA